MFFTPKIYKFEGEIVALQIVEKIKTLGYQGFLANAETIVGEGLQSFGISKSSSKQKKQICQLAVRFHEHGISRSDNSHMVPQLRDQILKDFR